jgi:ubiquitin carboxyl-terminal hydrolase 7
LIHRGGYGAGHYYTYIRPTLEDKWYEFNDSKVTRVLKSTALNTGYGGSDTYFEVRDGKAFEKQRTDNTSAYMLVYVRDGDREEIMREIAMDDIPFQLKERFDEENNINAKLEKDQGLLNDCGAVYVITQETI